MIAMTGLRGFGFAAPESGTALARYDAARGALAAARSIDEVKEVRDKVEALRLYARQAHDVELETWAAEIKLRAQRRLGELSRDLETSKGGRNPAATLADGGMSKRAALKAAGISTSAAHRCEAVAAIPEAEFETFIAGRAAAGQPVHAGEAVKTLRHAARRAAAMAAQGSHRTDTTADLAALAADVAAGARPPFGCILADPAWEYETWSEGGQGRSAAMKYRTMTEAEIAALGAHVRVLPADDCLLMLWGVWPQLPGALAVIAAWGFTYKTCGLLWEKLNPSGEGFHEGMGKWTRANTEPCLLATRGAPFRLNTDVDQLLVAPRGRHSEKPAEAHARIERLVGGPYLELFGRARVPGWTVWGNEVAAPGGGAAVA
jgi:N6-adenosine-specific RNA methylase IME4